MTREETAKLIEWYRRNLPAMEAYRDGGELIGGVRFEAMNPVADPTWTMTYEYRIKPAPKIRPYNREECEALVGKAIRHKTYRSVGLVLAVHSNCHVSVSGVGGNTENDLFNDFEHLDGSPCGVVE